MKKKIYTLSVLLAAVLPAGAQSIKSDINTVLNDIALPVFLGVMVMALAVGIGKIRYPPSISKTRWNASSF